MLAAAAARAGDPNFPEGGLAITPSYAKYHDGSKGAQARSNDDSWQEDNQADIDEYGIAGRVWEAAYVLMRYLSRQGPGSDYLLDPPCSIFDSSTAVNVLELGAGAGIAGMCLARELAKGARLDLSHPQSVVVLTDLDNVLGLLHRNVQRAGLGVEEEQAAAVKVKVRALPWGSTSHADAVQNDFVLPGLTHIVCSDLVYFPELLSPLLRSLVYLTEQRGQHGAIEVIIGYKLRSYAKEEPFWRAFGVWFDFAPVLCKRAGESDWRRLGARSVDFGASSDPEALPEDEMFVFVAHRKQNTMACEVPLEDEHLLGGWMLRDGALVRGTGAETFELLLMTAIQDE